MLPGAGTPSRRKRSRELVNVRKRSAFSPVCRAKVSSTRKPRWASAAAELARRVEAAYWLDDLQFYAMALDGEGRPCRVRASNAGHLLYCGLPAPERGRSVARQLMSKLLNSERIMQLRETLNKVVVADPIRDFACRLVLATHPHSEYSPAEVKRFIRWGASPRAAHSPASGWPTSGLSREMPRPL